MFSTFSISLAAVFRRGSVGMDWDVWAASGAAGVSSSSQTTSHSASWANDSSHMRDCIPWRAALNAPSGWELQLLNSRLSVWSNWRLLVLEANVSFVLAVSPTACTRLIIRVQSRSAPLTFVLFLSGWFPWLPPSVSSVHPSAPGLSEMLTEAQAEVALWNFSFSSSSSSISSSSSSLVHVPRLISHPSHELPGFVKLLTSDEYSMTYYSAWMVTHAMRLWCGWFFSERAICAREAILNTLLRMFTAVSVFASFFSSICLSVGFGRESFYCPLSSLLAELLFSIKGVNMLLGRQVIHFFFIITTQMSNDSWYQ